MWKYNRWSIWWSKVHLSLYWFLFFLFWPTWAGLMASIFDLSRSDSGDEEARSFELPDGKIIQVRFEKCLTTSIHANEKKRFTDTLSNWVSRFPDTVHHWPTLVCVFPFFVVLNGLFIRSAKKSALVLQRSSLVVLRESDYLSVVISVDSWIQSPEMVGKSCWNS